MPAAPGDTVTVHYRGLLEDGTVFDSSEGREPLTFTLGAGEVIPGFEQGVIGLEPGDKATVTIQPDDAYGPRYEEAVQEVPLDLFGESAPDVGMLVNVIAEDGTPLTAQITAISDDLMNATLDFNHPLAGRTLTFEIELISIAR